MQTPAPRRPAEARGSKGTRNSMLRLSNKSTNINNNNNMKQQQQKTKTTTHKRTRTTATTVGKDLDLETKTGQSLEYIIYYKEKCNPYPICSKT